MGYEPENVASASFVLAQEYKARYPIIHIDLYRLDDKDEILSLDWDFYLSDENILLIEWADKAGDFIRCDLTVNIDIISETGRAVLFKAKSGHFDGFLNML